jgi:hypothetical protein
MALYGAEVFKGRVWAPGVKIGGVEAPPEELIVDPNLVPVGQDPRYPSTDFIVIPRGRLCGIRTDSSAYDGKAVMTIADGVDPSNLPPMYYGGVRPQGYTEANVFKKWQERAQWTPTLQRESTIELPYVPTVNDAYGQLRAGDPLTAYFGTVSVTMPGPADKGKLVRWVGRRLYSAHQAASNTVNLNSAIYPAFPPTIVFASDAGTVVTASYTLAFSGTKWVATFASGTPTDVLYEFGQGAEMIAGSVLKIEPLSSTHQFDGWLQWVTDDFRVWDYPPALMRVPTSTATNENPVYNSLGYYRTLNYPIAPYLTITVTLCPAGTDSFTLTDALGNVTTVAAGTQFTLPLADVPYANWTMGIWHNINPITGELFLSTNVVFNGTYPAAGSSFYAIEVSYSYETSYRDGRLYNAGIQGLTDGSGGTGFPGTPTNLDVVGGAGAIRAMIAA